MSEIGYSRDFRSAPNLTNHRAVDEPARTSDDHGVWGSPRRPDTRPYAACWSLNCSSNSSGVK